MAIIQNDLFRTICLYFRPIERLARPADKRYVRLAVAAMVWTCLRRWPLLIAFAAISPSAALAANDSLIPVLDTGTQLFSNVTVTSKSITHVFIKHSRGFAGLKINELSH